jgi:transaldolase
MPRENFLRWLSSSTKTRWWHDSAEPEEVERAIRLGAVGATTNPMLANWAISSHKEAWGAQIREVLARGLEIERKAEELLRIPVMQTAERFLPEHTRSGGESGLVCGQVNPNRAGDRAAMLAMARRYHEWVPNIAVKLPATSAGLDVLEDVLAEGITATATVSFTVPQVVAVAERHRAAIRRARAAGKTPGRCFAVIMIGRLDDYLREVSQDVQVGVTESDIRQAGIAVTKRAYALYRERGYEATLLVAAFRGNHHATEIAGADLIVSITPQYQETLQAEGVALEERIDRPVEPDVLGRLGRLPEFRRAYEPDGMKPSEFVAYGVTQRTLCQFCEQGWNPLERFRLG